MDKGKVKIKARATIRDKVSRVRDRDKDKEVRDRGGRVREERGAIMEREIMQVTMSRSMYQAKQVRETVNRALTTTRVLFKMAIRYLTSR
jgi:hypothetical protein